MPDINMRHGKWKEYCVHANHLEFCVRQYGDEAGIPLLLIMGLGCQMTFWPQSFINALVDAGFHVYCFDNRDVGLSARVPTSRRIDTRLAFLRHRMGLRFQTDYTLFDMACDTAHLIDQLDLRPSHVLGASMGGMIAQILAARYPNRVRSLNVMMSTTNAPRLPLPDYSLLLKLGWGGPQGHSEEEAVARLLRFWQAIQSPVYPATNEEIGERIRSNFRRAYSPGGTLRQLHAILATGSIKRETANITAPTLVLHGAEDPLLKPACGKDIYDTLRCKKEWALIRGMAHDMPLPLQGELVQRIVDHCQQYELLHVA